MTSKHFMIADVFTEKQFGGNQLAVFTDGSGLDTETMQNIAREMNYSETTFLLPPEHGGDFRIRIFTPGQELPIRGTSDCRHRLRHSRREIETVERAAHFGEARGRRRANRVEVRVEGGRPGRSTMTQPLPVVRGVYSNIEALAKALSLDPSLIDQRLPVETVYNGIAVMIVPLTTRAAIESIQLDGGALARISNEVGAQTVLTFTRETVSPESTVHCRVFAPAAGVGEDAATGSANGPLGAYLVRHKLVPVQATTKIVSEQGFEMKRPSILHIDVDVDQSGSVSGVRVGGGVVISGRGEIFVR